MSHIATCRVELVSRLGKRSKLQLIQVWPMVLVTVSFSG
ncbi:hypothetical protein KPSA1_01449 [Pseudomonas syringae pv. actinidiae]|uniref:Uncharacterized protein n=1 Tax=Pseudomonas syringae pv. actinidiae TaxID=103796 RepID=A0A2V0Q6D3_PSESF|nr:hypothetical protein KPSA1_01449 [Pseudomonas syringae pv. actinidiae]GBH15482.1 hypothetical protein KPSA3_01409 [Pseudomonas syringae pv. actinidiae]